MPDGGLPTLRLAVVLARLRWRHLRNGLRGRPGRRAPVVAGLVGVLVSVSYVGLFTQAFRVMIAHAPLAGQAAALAIVVGAIALGTFAAKAASSEAVVAGSAENELLLSRPVSLASLVAARSLSEALVDPLGALFMLPVLVAAAIAWGLDAAAWVVAAGISVLVQIALSALAQATQIVLVRYVGRARRRTAWVGLRLLASLALAAIWMLGTSVLRAPAELAARATELAPALAFTPVAAVVGPLLALRLGHHGAALAGLAVLVTMAALAVGLAWLVARRASARGWEEGGAPWAESAARPARGRPITAASKDLRLVARDRSQLIALLAMPVIFVGIQLFGAAGWSWSVASLRRVAYLSFSTAAYVAAMGPLAHMQAERRAFWILRTVPVPIASLMAAKARIWALLLGTCALVTFLAFSSGVADWTVRELLILAVLVTAGAAGMAVLGVALACSSADLSDDQRPAIGPATIYLFLLIAGLWNGVLASDDPGARLHAIALFAVALAACWQTGMERVARCFDPEQDRRALTMADGALLAVLLHLGRVAGGAASQAAGAPSQTAAVVAIAVHIVVGAAALWLVARGDRGRHAMSLAPAMGVAIAVGVGMGLLAATGLMEADRSWLPAHRAGVAVAVLAAAAGEELVFRGVVQGALERRLGAERLAARGGAALVAGAVAWVAGGPLAPGPGGPLLTIAVAAAVRGVTGRTSASLLVRVIGLSILLRQ